ncbi:MULTISPECIES: DUF3500 domain-containing protein [unclassified Streptomyces]|uniref:DUF3500 domain-containing protein n=1 Tax=unclassified Streptomyces TaxID=2593676 RepID=UPI000F71F360|nr:MULTISPECIES: DUF3500 domain-containing protein [unclassified Streptomyces]AZM60695.1 hypothetical protein DLM49_14985 [Streptomyces sp. WAC 01438]RSM92608.1 hypothetical protein DMA10_24100 [Streptomyces sp. WAC 01420]
MRIHPAFTAGALASALLLTACTGSQDSGAEAELPSSLPNTVSGGPTVSGATEAVVAAADVFLESLSEEQRERALYDRDDTDALQDWTNLPVGQNGDRNGVGLRDLSEDQRAAAMGVADAVLSDDGFEEMRAVVAAGDVLDRRGGGDTSFGSDLFFFAFFGEPSTTERFTVQIGGHHLAVHTTYDGDRVMPTPAFSGVDPRAFEVSGSRVEPLRDEADGVFDVLGALSDEQRDRARIDGEFAEILVGPGEDGAFPTPAQGVRVSDLPAEGQELVTTAIRAWVGDSDERVAEALMAEYEADYDETYIGWAGSTDRDEPGAYVRFDGPRLWIEFSNQSQTGSGDSLHYHSVYRDKQRDYGRA